MSVIKSGRMWAYQVVGEVPPGVSEDDWKAVVLTSVAWTASMLPLIRQHGFNVLADTEVPPDLRGPKLSLS